MLVDSPKTHTIIAKGDSAATNHYITEQDSLCLKNIKPNNSINVTLPNSVAISSNKQGELPLSDQLSTKGKTAINPLIDDNIFNLYLSQANHQHKANVILRKKRSKIELA